MMSLRGLKRDAISAGPSTAPGRASDKRRGGRGGSSWRRGRGWGAYLGRSPLGQCVERALCPAVPTAAVLRCRRRRLTRRATGAAVASLRACAAPWPIGGRRARGPGQWRHASVPRAVAKGSGGRGPIATAGPRWTQRGHPAGPPPTGERGWRRRARGPTGLGGGCLAWRQRPVRG